MFLPPGGTNYPVPRPAFPRYHQVRWCIGTGNNADHKGDLSNHGPTHAPRLADHRRAQHPRVDPEPGSGRPARGARDRVQHARAGHERPRERRAQAVAQDAQGHGSRLEILHSLRTARDVYPDVSRVPTIIVELLNGCGWHKPAREKGVRTWIAPSTATVRRSP